MPAWSSLRNHVVVVVGAGGGIGKEIALLLRKEHNVHLALADCNIERLRETVAELDFLASSAPAAAQTPSRASPASKAGKAPLSPAKASPAPALRSARTTTHVVDVTDRAQVNAFAEEVQALHGRCELVFNNAGVACTHAFHDVDVKELDRVLDINLFGVINVAKAFLPLLIKSERACLACTSSMEGFFAIPGNSGYVMSKFAVRGLCETLLVEGAELYPHVQIACIMPGLVKTKIIVNSSAHMLDTQLGGPHRLTHPESIQRVLSGLSSTTPQEAARQIVDGIVRGRTRILVGTDAKILDLAVRVAPHFFYKSWAFKLLVLPTLLLARFVGKKTMLALAALLLWLSRRRWQYWLM